MKNIFILFFQKITKNKNFEEHEKKIFFEISRTNYDLKYIGRYHFLLDSDLQIYSTVRLGQNLVFKAENAF